MTTMNEFSASLLITFRNHSNMLIWC